jgi:excisionase family DNA binding protein
MKVQPLICHPPLLPDESLSSLLERLAKFNNYEPRSILSTIIRESVNLRGIRRLGCPSQTTLFETIAALTNIEPFELQKATSHYFTGILTPPENEIECLEISDVLSIPLLSKGIANKHLRPEYACQFCPLCIKDAVYHRLIWLPIASAVCLEHKCLLVNACPKCRNQVRIQDLIEANCSKCKTDLTEAPTVSVIDDSFGLFTQDTIQTWLMEGVSPVSTSYPLPQQMPRDLYRMIDGMRISIMQVNQDWPLLHHAAIQQNSVEFSLDAQAQTLTPYQSYCLYATAFKGIIDWPDGFHRFLTAYKEREKKSRYHNGFIFKGLCDELGNLYMLWINKRWKQPTLEFVQEAFHQYLVENHTSFPATALLTRYKDTPKLSDNLCYMSVNEAAKLLGVTHGRIRLMIRTGRLKSYNEKGKSWATLVKREDVLELHDEWERAIELKEVINWLGVSKKVVSKLVQIGLLTAQQSPTDGFHWMFSPSAVTECLERVIKGTSGYTIGKNKNGENMLSLTEASKLLYRLGLGGNAFTLQQVAENRLRAYVPTDQTLRLGILLFSRTDIDAYLEVLKAEQGWIGRDEVTSILKISRGSITKWIKAGLISPVEMRSNTYYFDREAIVKLKADLVISKQASAILGIPREAVYDLVYQGRLKAVRGPIVDGFAHYVFSRGSLQQWRDPRVTLDETSQLLGVSRRRIIDWVKQGRMFPLDDKELKPWYFSRQALNRYKESGQEHSNSNIPCTDRVPEQNSSIILRR